MPFHPVVDPDFVGPPEPPSLLDRIINGVGEFVEAVTTTAATVAQTVGILRPDDPNIIFDGATGPLPVESRPAPSLVNGGGLFGGAGLPLLLVGAVIVAVLFLPR